MSKILITGGAGFIGSHLAKQLSVDHAVYVLDNLSGGHSSNVPDNVKLYVNDITNEKAINNLFEKHQFDYVYHLAAYAAEGLSHFIRSYNYKNNVIGSINLINASITYDVKKFIFTSSMGVYGTNQVPYDEEMKPAPEDPYGIAKYSIEQDLVAAYKMFGLNYVIFRPHNVYGPKQNIWDKYRNVIGIFMNQILNNQPMTIFGDGNQVRAFSYIDDIIYGMKYAISGCLLDREIINIGGEQTISINELASMVADIFENEKKIIHLPERFEVKNAFSNHSKIKNLIGQIPHTEFKVGLKLMAEWAKKNYLSRETSEFLELEQTKNIPNKWL